MSSQTYHGPKRFALSSLGSRDELIEILIREKVFDIVIVGGGIKSAIFANLCALNGFTTLLLEKNDYGLNIHCFDSELEGKFPVFTDFKTIQRAFNLKFINNIAYHLIERFDFDIGGLSWNKRACFSVENAILSGKASDAFKSSKIKIILNERRFLHEVLFSARQEGAICLNYFCLDSYGANEDGSLTAGIMDKVSGQKFETTTRALVDMSGGFAGRLANVGGKKENRKYLLFFDSNHKVKKLSLAYKEPFFLLVAPYRGGVVAQGYSEDGSKNLSIEDFENSLHTINLAHPLHKQFSFCSDLNIGSPWVFSNNVLRFKGQNLKDFRQSARVGLNYLKSILFPGPLVLAYDLRPLPGLKNDLKVRDDFVQRAHNCGIENEVIQRVQKRYGYRVRKFLEDEEYFEVAENGCLKGEILMSIQDEQGVCLEDVERRLEVDFTVMGAYKKSVQAAYDRWK